MNNKLQVELLYNSRKKSMAVAYIWGFFLGSIGISYFYLGKPDWGSAVIGLFIFSYIIPSISVIWALVVVLGVVHTYFLTNEVNEGIRLECEMLLEEDKNG